MVSGDAVPVRPLAARSVVLSLLLGAHPPALAVRDLVRAAGVFGVSEPTLRVALTRMVAGGDLERDGTSYRLTLRLLQRQRRQDEALAVRTTDWAGDWEMAVITAVGRPAGDRARLRGELIELRLGELRDGVWLRPANLQRDLPARTEDPVQTFRVRDVDDPTGLAERLWPLDRWAGDGHALLRQLHGTVDLPGQRLAVAAAIVRHLRTDPALPEILLPSDWPGPALRAAYADYQRELVELRLVVPTAG